MISVQAAQPHTSARCLGPTDLTLSVGTESHPPLVGHLSLLVKQGCNTEGDQEGSPLWKRGLGSKDWEIARALVQQM